MKLFSLESERNILGQLLLESRLSEKIDQISEGHFINPIHQKVLKAMKKLVEDGKPIDIQQIYNLCKEVNIVEMTDWTTWCALTTFDSSLAILEECKQRRELKARFQQGIEDVECEDVPIDDIKSNIITDIQASLQGESLSDSPYERVSRTWEKILAIKPEDRAKWQTGLTDFDRLTGGIYAGDFTNIAAASGVGKTAFALQIARNLTKNGLKGLFVSREMKEERIDFRLIASLTGIDTRKIRNAELSQSDLEKIQQVLFKDLANRSLIISDRLSAVSQIKNRLRKEHFDFVIVDYIQLIDPETKGDTREQQVASISRRLKALTLEFNLAVIGLTQVNGYGEARESRAIFFDSDNYIKIRKIKDEEWEKLCKKKNYLKSDLLDAVREMDNDIVLFDVEKQRDGGVGTFPTLHVKNKLEYRPISDREDSMVVGMTEWEKI